MQHLLPQRSGGPHYEVLPIDMGAANEGIMTEGGQCASFPGHSSPSVSKARGRGKGLGERQ